MKDDEIKIFTAGKLARMIKAEREKRGWTIYRLAQKSDVHAAHIARIEEGMLAPRTDTLQKICAALKFEITFPLSF